MKAAKHATREHELKVVKTSIACKGKRLTLKIAYYRVGKRLRVRDYVEHPGSVAVLPIVDDCLLLLLRHWRVAVNNWVVEVPAGTLEEGEKPEEAAIRELIEETGLEPLELRYVGVYYPSPGTSSEVIYLFIAPKVRRVSKGGLEDEPVQYVYLHLDEALRWIAQGLIRDMKTALLVTIYNSLLTSS